jgi:hypothetical protein
MQPKKRRYFFDADGVLFLYERDAYSGSNPKWLRKNEHYFRNLQPDMRMRECIDLLHERVRYTGDEIYILTSLRNDGLIFNEHLHDKIVSFQKWFEYIDIDHILISTGQKRDTVEYITNNEVTNSDILIDDFNVNLNEWSQAGGTAVKYCNGINTPSSWLGHKLNETNDANPKDMATILLNLGR